MFESRPNPCVWPPSPLDCWNSLIAFATLKDLKRTLENAWERLQKQGHIITSNLPNLARTNCPTTRQITLFHL